MQKNKKLALIILDGWGYGRKDKSDSIFQSKTPVFDQLIKNYPNSKLLTDGEHVGLPAGQMGNSEVGHLNIGAGRVVFQDLVKINQAVYDNSIANNKELLDAFGYAKKEGKQVHFIGLISDGGIHSHQNHLIKLCEVAAELGINETFIHAFTDGRDTDPNSGLEFLKNVQEKLSKTGAKIASICGRYYAMDRDLRWERIKFAYDALVKGKGNFALDPIEAISKSYEEGITDEFIKPIVIKKTDGALAKINQGDVVICFNYRTDRCREITRALCQEDFIEHGMERLDLYYVTMTNYDESFKDVHVLFSKDNLKNTLGEVISNSGRSQIRIAETEKYPHVTFFFSGGRETPFKGEKRLMASSPKVATYDLKPEMSAEEVKTKIISEIENNQPDFICLNFANPDMVGHSGVQEAIIKAVETVDKFTGEIVNIGVTHDYSFLIIADHGNADYTQNDDGSPNTAHTTNPVPVILIDGDYKTINAGKLADIAPTILKIMDIDIPEEMNGNILV